MKKVSTLLALMGALGMPSLSMGETAAVPPQQHQEDKMTMTIGRVKGPQPIPLEKIVDVEEEFQQLRKRNKQRNLSKGSKKSSKCSKKSSKSGSVCEDDIEISCAGLQELVFELNTKIDDVEAETLRFSALTNELGRTADFAETGQESSRKLARKTDDAEGLKDLETSVQKLDRQRQVLKTGNERVSELNALLHESAEEWFVRNSELLDSNGMLRDNVDLLIQENLLIRSERDELSTQIDSLRSEIDNLSGLIDDHSDLNGALNQTTADLEAQIDRLQASNEEYARLNEELSDSLDELNAQNAALEEQNAIFAGLNQDLNATAQELQEQVGLLEGQVDGLTTQNDRLADLLDNLQEQKDELSEVNDQLETNVEDLQDEVGRLETQVDELQEVNSNLETITSFLNETAGDIDETVDSLAVYLSEQIQAYRSLATETVHNTYIQRVALWDCAYRDHFGDEPFGLDDSLEIPADKFDDVIDYINERVLEEICLSDQDFEAYLSSIFNDPVFTTDHFVSGLNSYSTLAFNYYFPDGGESGGLTEQDWASAEYSCQGLPAEKLFTFSKAN